MAILKKSGSSPFYKTGPLYITGDPIDPTKKKAAEKEAKAKADKSAASAERVYGKSTTKTERITSAGGRKGTKTTVTTPYTKSGTGSAEFNTAYGAAKKAGKKTFDYGGKSIKVEDAASKSGKDVRSTVKYDKVKGLGLKPEGVKINTTGPKAPDPKVKMRKKPEPKLDLTSSGGSSTTIRTKKFESRSRKKKTGSGHPCKSCN
jgi:cytoskeletal protein RodZ